MPVTQEDLDTPNTVEILPLGSVSTPPIESIPVPPDVTVDFTPITVDTELNNDTLNQSARTLRDDINTKLAAANSANAQSVSDLAAAVSAALSVLVSNTNKQLGITGNNLQALINSVNDAQTKIAALDDVYGTDIDIAQRIKEVNNLIAVLNSTGSTAVDAINLLIASINGLPLIYSKEITVNTNDGVYQFDLATQAVASGVYTVNVDVIGNKRATAHITDKTVSGFNINLESNGVHVLPQPIDCSSTPVKVSVLVNVARPPVSSVPI